MAYTFTVWFLLALFGKEAFSQEKENIRRILLSDPNVVQQELLTIKASLQEQQSKVAQLEHDRTTQLSQITQLQQDKVTQESQITQLQQDKVTQESLITQLQQDNSTQASLIIQLQQDNSTHASLITQLQQDNSTHASLITQLQQDKVSQANTIVKLQSEIAKVNSDLSRYQSSAFGTVYTRWGRKVCPDNETELVYSGIVGGSLYNQTSAAAEYVCLPTDPIWSKYDENVQYDQAKMYGAEYQSNFFKSGLYNNEVPCAVCRRKSVSSVIMLAGRNQCYNGWRTEYFGYLASGGYPYGHQAATQFVCLDANPEVVFHSSRDDNGKLFYMVEGICGSLSCPPYVNGRELTCSVCTK